MLALALLFFRRLVDMDILEFTDGFQGSRAFRKSRALAACKTLQARTSCVALRIISPSVAVGGAPRALTCMFRSTKSNQQKRATKKQSKRGFPAPPFLPLGRVRVAYELVSARQTARSWPSWAELAGFESTAHGHPLLWAKRVTRRVTTSRRNLADRHGRPPLIKFKLLK